MKRTRNLLLLLLFLLAQNSLSQAQCCNSGPNLIPGGGTFSSFTLGGASTDFAPGNPVNPLVQGIYTVTTDPEDWAATFDECSNFPTDPFALFIGFGDGGNHVVLGYNLTGLTPGCTYTYQFTLYPALDNQPGVDLDVEINGSVVQDVVSNVECTSISICGTFTATGTTALFEIVENSNTTSSYTSGYVYGIDDVYFGTEDLAPINDTTLCQGDTWTVTPQICGGGTYPAGTQYTWYVAGPPPNLVLSFAPTYTVTGPGSYCVDITTPSGCTWTECFTVTQAPNPNVVATQPTIDWCCGDGNLIVGAINITTGNVIPFSPTLGGFLFTPFAFFPGTGFGSYSFPPCVLPSLTPIGGGPWAWINIDVCNCPTGNHTLTYTFTNASGCSGTASTDIVIDPPPPPPLISAAQTYDLCSNTGTVSLAAACTGTGTTGAWTSSSAPAGSFNFTTGVFDPQFGGGVAPGTYTFTYTCTNSCGSTSATTTVTVTQSPLTNVTALVDTIDWCCGNGDLVVGIINTSTGNVIPYSSSLGTLLFTPFSFFGGSGAYNLPPCALPSLTPIFGPWAWINLDLCNCPPGPHTLTYQYTETNGCTGTASLVINIGPPPNPPLIVAPLTYDICNNTGTLTLAAACTGTGVTGGWTSTTAPAGTFNATTGVFDPQLAGPGFYTFTYTCTNTCGSTSATTSVTVTNDGFWHQTTENANARDLGLDVHVDPNGDVFQGGSFNKNTDITDHNSSVTILNPASTEQHAFVTKYDECGELQWLLYDQDPKFSEAIAVHESNGILFIGLNIDGATTLTGLDSSGVAIPGSTSPTIIGDDYVIFAYDAATGVYIDHFQWFSPSTTSFERIQAIDVRNVQGTNYEVYISGRDVTSTNDCFAQKLSFNSAGPLFAQIWTTTFIGNGVTPTQNSARDIEYAEDLDLVLVTGGFAGPFNVGGTILTPAGSTDAYYAVLNSGTGAVTGTNQLGSPNFGEGTVIVSNDVDHIYFMGNFWNPNGPVTITNPFSFPPSPLTQTGFTPNGYIVSINYGGGALLWSENLYQTGPSGRVNLTGGDVTGNTVSACGEMGIGQFFGGSTTGINSPFTAPRLFISTYQHGGGSWTGSYDNGSIAPAPARHIGTHMSSKDDETYAYMTGSYFGTLDVINATPPPNNPLPMSSTGTFGLTICAHILRNDLTTGALRSSYAGPVVNNKDEAIEILVGRKPSNPSTSFDINVFPNPTTDIVNISVNEGSNQKYDVAVFNMLGEKILNLHQVGDRFSIDLTDYASGIYNVELSNSQGKSTVRVVKK